MVTSTIHLAMSGNMLGVVIFHRQAKFAVKQAIRDCRQISSARNSVLGRRTTGTYARSPRDGSMLARKKKPRQGRAGRGRRLLEAEVLGCNTIAGQP
jgi:hypothetical protein